MTEIEVAETLAEADERRVESFLGEYCREHGFPWEPEPLNILLREDGELVGGLVGYTIYHWLYIKTLGISKTHRRYGHGRKLMLQSEQIATERGCVGIWLDTFSFQAPAFYKKLGYKVFGQIDDFPTSQTRYFFMKRLA